MEITGKQQVFKQHNSIAKESMGGYMNRRFLMVISLFVFVLLASACGSKKAPADSQTQEVVQASNPTPTPEQASATSATAVQTGEGSQGEASVANPTAEPTQVPATEQAAPTQALANTGGTTSSSSAQTTNSGQQAAAPEATACLNKAAFYADVTIPDDTVIRQGEKFTKTWQVRNEGDCTWKDYKLVYAGGEAMNAAPSNPIPEAKPGDIIEFSVDMTAPGRGGTYLSYWQFSTTSGQTFGVGSGANGMLWARIQVDYSSGETTIGSTSTTQTDNATTTNVSTGGTTNSSSSSSSSTPSNSSSTPSSTPAGCNYTLNPDYENQILNLINKARADNGLGPVTRDSELDAAALEHSLDMACNNFISHTGSDGSLWYQRTAKHGFANSNSARENIYTGSPDFGGDAAGAFTWWMNSKIHRDNILYDSVTEVGISYVYCANATYGGLYTLVLARP